MYYFFSKTCRSLCSCFQTRCCWNIFILLFFQDFLSDLILVLSFRALLALLVSLVALSAVVFLAVLFLVVFQFALLVGIFLFADLLVVLLVLLPVSLLY